MDSRLVSHVQATTLTEMKEERYKSKCHSPQLEHNIRQRSLESPSKDKPLPLESPEARPNSNSTRSGGTGLYTYTNVEVRVGTQQHDAQQMNSKSK